MEMEATFTELLFTNIFVYFLILIFRGITSLYCKKILIKRENIVIN